MDDLTLGRTAAPANRLDLWTRFHPAQPRQRISEPNIREENELP